ncbi:MAG: hypothetical protein ACRDJ9_31995 [Dehalococcoidia bacterium]
MTNAQTTVLVLKDQAGTYFVLPPEALERWRLPEEHTAEIERLIAEQEDVQGHLIPLIIGLTVAGAAGAWIGATAMNALLDDAATVGRAPTLDVPLPTEPIRGPGGAPV